MEDDEDVPQLSADTFAALQDFYAEQQKRQEIFTKLEAENKLTENILFDENWVKIYNILAFLHSFARGYFLLFEVYSYCSTPLVLYLKNNLIGLGRSYIQAEAL